MKSHIQIALLILGLAALIGGVTFLAQYGWNGRSPSSPTPTARPEPPLVFPQTSAQWDGPGPNYAAESEVGRTGFHDFGFENREPCAVELAIRAVQGPCSAVQVGIQERIGQTAPTQGITWHPLMPGKSGPAVVPPAVGKSEPTRGVVRISWESPRLGRAGVVIELEGRAQPAGPAVPIRLTVPVVVVPALRIYPARVELGELRRGQPGTATFWCWSSTRPGFSLWPPARDVVPWFDFACTPLTADECRELERRLAAQNLPTRVLAGYRVVVTGHEQRPGVGALDLGPLQRTIALSTDPGLEPPRLDVTGVVRGPVQVGSGNEKDRIDLGNFAAAQGTSARPLVLTAEEPGMQVQLDRCVPDYLVAKLEEISPPGTTGLRRWKLRVDVPPDCAAGPMPAGSAVWLRLTGAEPRRLRIPLTGNAYR